MNDEPASKVFENMSACMTLTSSGDVKLNRNHLTSAWITPGFVVFVFVFLYRFNTDEKDEGGGGVGVVGFLLFLYWIIL